MCEIHQPLKQRVTPIMKRLEQHIAGCGSTLHHLLRLIRVHCKRLFAQHVLAGIERCQCPPHMVSRRQCVVHQINIFAFNERRVALRNAGYAMVCCKLLCF